MLSIMLGSGEWADIGREAVFGRCAAWARQRYIVFGDIEDAEWYGHYVTSQCPHVSCRIADADGNVVRTIEDANLWRDQEGREAVLKEMRERRWWQFWKW